MPKSWHERLLNRFLQRCFSVLSSRGKVVSFDWHMLYVERDQGSCRYHGRRRKRLSTALSACEMSGPPGVSKPHGRDIHAVSGPESS